MSDQATLIWLIIANTIVLIIFTFIRKKISTQVYKRVSEIEDEELFVDKIKIIKTQIDTKFNEDLDQKISTRKKHLIEDAIKRSTSVSKGKITEHFAPFMLPDIFNPDEIVFIGSPIDLISFTNIDTEDAVSIDFLEIKTGNASLNKKQKLIKDAVVNKRVYFKTIKLK